MYADILVFLYSSRNEFTPGQEERLFTLWDNFREGL